MSQLDAGGSGGAQWGGGAPPPRGGEGASAPLRRGAFRSAVWTGGRPRPPSRATRGSTQCLINISDWDFNWQGMYRYKTPMALPVGTRIALSAYYDNSADNPRNPNSPPRAVSWGEATTDEMCIAFIGVTLDGATTNANMTVAQAGFK